MSEDLAPDPVLVRRARWARASKLGKRLGYGLFGLACIAFALGFGRGFSTWGPVMVAMLLTGSALLLPAIIFGYAVKAADRADQGLPDGH